MSAIVLGLALVAAGSAHAQSGVAGPGCQTITDSLLRLRCYDERAKQPLVPAPPVGAVKVASDFSAYRVSDVYRGPVKLPNFKGAQRDYVFFRTRLRDGMRAGANFAGRFALIEIGCGAGCRAVYVGDISTGAVSKFPLGGEDNMYLDLKYQTDSRLVIAHWETEGRCMREQLVWTGSAFDQSKPEDLGSDDLCRSPN